MLTTTTQLPPRFLELKAQELYQILPGSTLIHLEGKRKPSLFVSVLLHGNEDTGFRAVQELLRKYQKQVLPRSLSLFVGNVEAARYQCRRLEHQLDFNRIWNGGDSPEHKIIQQVLDEMREKGTFASVDIHNNTGVNPHYACVNRLEDRFFHLAVLFSRTVVYFIRPEGVQTAAFAEFCPAVTLECGKLGDHTGIAHAQAYLEACLHLAEIPNHPVPPHDLDLFHTVATVKIPEHLTLSFGDEDADVCLIQNLDHLNFTELPAGTFLGSLPNADGSRLLVLDEQGNEVGDQYFIYENGAIRTKVPIMPSMFTLNHQVIRQDCLGYLMERLKNF